MSNDSENEQPAAGEPPPPPPPPSAAPSAPPEPATPLAPAGGTGTPDEKSGGGCFKIGCLGAVALLLVVGITVAITWWVITRKETFEPVILEQPEQVVLDTKLETIELISESGGNIGREPNNGGQGIRITVPPEASTDPTSKKPVVDPEEAERTLVITQRELNSLFHKDSGLGDTFKIMLVRNGITVKMSKQIPEDSAIMPGKNIRGKLGLYIAKEDDTFVVKIDGISLGGFPVPSDWLEALSISEDVNLLEDFFGGEDTLRKFSAGIEEFNIKDGRILLKLAE